MTKPHIVYLTQYYLTDASPGGQRHFRHVRHLLDQGYRVTVISSYVNYQTRQVPEQFVGRKVVVEEQGDLRIIWTYAYPGYGRDLVSRLRNYFSFTWNALVQGNRVGKADVVLVSSPPLFLGMTGWLLARRWGVPMLFEVRDLWPETAVAMGFVTNPVIVRPAEWLEKGLYRTAAHVIALTEGIRDGVIRHGIAPEKVTLIPNAADLDMFPTPECTSVAHPLIPRNPGDFVAVFAGVHSTYSALPTLIHAAQQLQVTHPHIRIVLVGTGDSKAGLIELTGHLRVQNVTFVDQQPKRAIPGILAAADCCILPYQNLDLFRGALPNKTFDYLAAGRPIVVAVLDGELSRLIGTAGAGLVVPPEDPAALAEALVSLAERPAVCAAMGQAGRAYVERHFDRRSVLERYGRLFREVLAR